MLAHHLNTLQQGGFEGGQKAFPHKYYSKYNEINNLRKLVAEGVGFEPTVRFPARRFSRPLP
jgi:hypothetical protein